MKHIIFSAAGLLSVVASFTTSEPAHAQITAIRSAIRDCSQVQYSVIELPSMRKMTWTAPIVSYGPSLYEASVTYLRGGDESTAQVTYLSESKAYTTCSAREEYKKALATFLTPTFNGRITSINWIRVLRPGSYHDPAPTSNKRGAKYPLFKFRG